MKAFNKICIIISFFVVLIFTLSNILMLKLNNKKNEREYRVEINRISYIMKNEGLHSVNLDDYKYVFNIEEYSSDFYNTNNDYIIKDIDGNLYRFDYKISDFNNNLNIIYLNISLAVMTICVIFVLLFIRYKILKSFSKLTNMAYEIARGNLNIPLKEEKNKYFGKFVWGLNLLREKLEEQKQKELELEREKKTLLLSLSHDIKTPLSAIKLYSKAIEKGLYNVDKTKEIALSINDNVSQIETLLSMIVSASKEDFLSIEVKVQEFYLKSLLDEIQMYYKEKLKLVQIPFILNGFKDCLLKGDLNRSVEVIQNIVENAIKYGDGKLIEISAYEEDSSILIEIKNSGNTLSDNEISHIFESFFRGSNIKNSKGSGLGLYIAREIMFKQKGDIFAKIDDENMIITLVFSKA